MKRLRAPLGWLGSAWRPFARRTQAICERCPWLEFCGRPTLVAVAGAAGTDGCHDVIVTFRVLRWLTAPVAKFVIVQMRLRSVDLPPERDFRVRITLPCECAALAGGQVPHRAPAATVIAGEHDTRVELVYLKPPSQRTGAPVPAARTSRSSAVISVAPVSLASAR